MNKGGLKVTKSKVMLIKVECLRETCFECYDEDNEDIKEMSITCISCPHSRYTLDE